MIEFDDRDLRDLQEAHGIVLKDVHGKRVAIAYGFDYENIFQFMSAYFKDYGTDDFAKQIGYEDDVEMLMSWFSALPFHESNLHETKIMNSIYKAFKAVDADSIQDPYDHEKEDRLEAEDHKLDQERGK